VANECLKVCGLIFFSIPALNAASFTILKTEIRDNRLPDLFKNKKFKFTSKIL
jgi:hypothetical protein